MPMIDQGSASFYLQHYGVKGMKWGVRRYRNTDGTLTEAGKKRYRSDIQNAKAQKKQSILARDRARKEGDLKAQQKALADIDYYSQEIADFKTRWKMEANSRKSKKQEDLEQKYQREYGLTKEEAELAAYRKTKTDRLVKVAAGVGVAAIAGYIAYRHYDDTVDRFVRGDLQTMATTNLDINRPFYASHNTYDKIIYGGGYAQALRKNHGKVIKNVVSIKDGGLKVAPRNTVTEHVNRLIKKDPQFRKNLEHLFEGLSYIKDPSLEGRQKLAKKALKEIQSGTISSKTYDLLNMYFNDSDASNTESPIFKNVGGIRSRIFKSLKDEGYGAVKDMHNARYGGFRSIDPLIVFEKSALNTPVSEVFSKNEARKQSALYDLKSAAGLAAIMSLSGAAPIKAASAFKRKIDTKLVKEYRKEHPNSKLSFNEIVRQIYSQ